jgi:hypothetical protein
LIRRVGNASFPPSFLAQACGESGRWLVETCSAQFVASPLLVNPRVGAMPRNVTVA